MPKRKMILILVICGAIAIFIVQTLSGALASNPPKPPDAKRQQNMSEAERKRKAERKKQWRLSQEKARQWRQALPEKRAEAEREFLSEKRALMSTGLTEEQWAIIKSKLEKVAKLQNLRELERSTSGLSLGSSSTGGKNTKANTNHSEPRWQWKRPWKNKAPAEMSEAQKIAEQLIRLLDQKNATTESLKRRMDALRKARIAEESEKQKREKELSDAQHELRKYLTVRQEAALVLKHRL